MPRSLAWLIMVLLLAMAPLTILWTSQRAHRYYYPAIPGAVFTAMEFPVIREFERTGRYELSCDATHADVAFKVVAKEAGTGIPVRGFNFLTRLCHGSESQGYGFVIEEPGAYELSASSLSPGTEVHFGFVNTPAMARWTWIGILAGSCQIGLAIMLLRRLMFTRLPNEGIQDLSFDRENEEC